MKKRYHPGKKHHPGKNPITPPSPAVAGLPQASPAMAALCLLAFVAAVLGLVLGYAGDSANRYFLLDHGGVLVKEYLLWQEHGFPIQKVISNYSQFFTDRFIPLLFSMLFSNPYLAVYLTSIYIWFMMALGAFLLARRCGAGSVAWLAWPLAGLMALLVVLDSTEEVFVTAITFGFRGHLNAMLPLMFYLAVSILFASSLKTAIRYAVVFVILFALLKFSYVIVSVWLTLPIVLTVGLALLARWLRFSSINWKILIAALVIGYLLESALHQTMVSMLYIKESVHAATDTTAWLSRYHFSLRQFFVNWGANIVMKHPLLSLTWAGFAALTLWAVYLGIFRKVAKKNKQHTMPTPALCALSFFLFAIILGMTATAVLGKYYLWGRWWHFANHRYFMPSIYIPLFWGIPTLLAFYLPALRRRFARIDSIILWGGSALAVIILVCALPLFRHLPQIGSLATYTSPFLECADSELEKRGLKTGIGPVIISGYLTTYLSDNEIQIIPMYNTRAATETYQRQDFPANQPPFRPQTETDKMPEDIEFIITNWTDARHVMTTPENARCPWRRENPRECYDYEWTPHAELFIKPEHITDYYGAPKEVFRCEGIDFYVYK
ncbi:MAG: hypothetical protein ACR2PV_07560 [Gammaproteobacteria bacterium]